MFRSLATRSCMKAKEAFMTEEICFSEGGCTAPSGFSGAGIQAVCVASDST